MMNWSEARGFALKVIEGVRNDRKGSAVVLICTGLTDNLKKIDGGGVSSSDLDTAVEAYCDWVDTMTLEELDDKDNAKGDIRAFFQLASWKWSEDQTHPPAPGGQPSHNPNPAPDPGQGRVAQLRAAFGSQERLTLDLPGRRLPIETGRNQSEAVVAALEQLGPGVSSLVIAELEEIDAIFGNRPRGNLIEGEFNGSVASARLLVDSNILTRVVDEWSNDKEELKRKIQSQNCEIKIRTILKFFGYSNEKDIRHWYAKGCIAAHCRKMYLRCDGSTALALYLLIRNKIPGEFAVIQQGDKGDHWFLLAAPNGENLRTDFVHGLGEYEKYPAGWAFVVDLWGAYLQRDWMESLPSKRTSVLYPPYRLAMRGPLEIFVSTVTT